MKSIYETLAALGAGAILLTGCGSSQKPALSPDVPAATETTPASDKAADPKQEATGDAAAADGAKTDNAAATPGSPAGPAASGAPSASASAVAKAPVKTGAKKGTGTGKKKDAAGSCGEGTCG
jgi:hypothetical protein